MDIEKLKQIKTLVEECIAEYDGGESSEMEGTEEYSEEPSSMGSGNDKIKMAVAAMNRASKK